MLDIEEEKDSNQASPEVIWAGMWEEKCKWLALCSLEARRQNLKDGKKFTNSVYSSLVDNIASDSDLNEKFWSDKKKIEKPLSVNWSLNTSISRIVKEAKHSLERKSNVESP